jgi:hypothetical protein
MTGTSIYVHSYIVCFKCFSISWCLLHQLWGFFKQKFIKLVADTVYARLEKKVDSLRKFSEQYTSEVLVYLFMLRRRAHNFTCADAATLATVQILMLWLQVLRI